MSDFNLDELMNEHTATALVDDATKRPAIPVGIYNGVLTFKKATKSTRPGFEDRTDLWFTVAMQDDAGKKYSSMAFLTYMDYRYDWDTQTVYKPGEPGHKQARMDGGCKLWGQLVSMFDKKGELTVKEQIETICEMPVQVGIKGKYENDEGDTRWAYNVNKAAELTAQGYYQTGEGINFFREVK